MQRCVSALWAFLLCCSTPAAAAEWTVMVFLNAKNNLEPAAFVNFPEMAAVGGTKDVNVLVQMGRPLRHWYQADGAEAWSGVMRFNVKKGTRPVRSEAVMDLGADGPDADMGSPDTLAKFIDWSIQNYPAKRYLLVVWNHGQGWRFQLAADPVLRTITVDNFRSKQAFDLRSATPPIGGFRSVSQDADTGHILYNSEIQRVLAGRFSQNKLDVLGFDACLMAMVETAYAFRNSTKFMVGSEELEPGEGWNYQPILEALTKNPQMEAAELSRIMVESYKKNYGDGELATLSALNLAYADSLAKSISALSDRMTSDAVGGRKAIETARSKIKTYGTYHGLNTSLDMKLFLEKFRAATADRKTKAAIDQVLAQIGRAVSANYASSLSRKDFGSNGIAVYFPADRAAFDNDPDSGAYKKDNRAYPVEFVVNQKWADFLAAYLK